jgi:hypothetical protein
MGNFSDDQSREAGKHSIGEVEKQNQDDRAFNDVKDKVFRDTCGWVLFASSESEPKSQHWHPIP